MICIIILKKVFMPFLMLFSSAFYKVFPKVRQDNPAEETIEHFIECKYGCSIDLSPETPEE